MKKAVVEIDSAQLLRALEQLDPAELKKIIDTLFLKRLLIKPDFKRVSADARRIIKKRKLGSEVVEGAAG